MDGSNPCALAGGLTSVCTIAGRCVNSIFTVWNMSTTPSYRIRSSTMLSVTKTPVRPTPALHHNASTHTLTGWPRKLSHAPNYHKIGWSSSVAGPTEWNSLPDSLRDPARCTNTFRSALKTHFFTALRNE